MVRMRWGMLALGLTVAGVGALVVIMLASHPVGEVAASRAKSEPREFESTYRPISPAPGAEGSSLAKGAADPRLGAVLASAGVAQDRANGEVAARDFAKLIMDSRPGSQAGEPEIASIASPALSPILRQYLVEDTDRQRELKTGRHYDLSRGGYYRSQAWGNANRPDRISLEIAGLVAVPGLDHQAWYATRYDVSWIEDKGWRLSDFSDGRFGPYTTTLTKQQRKEYLTGTGWRAFA